MADEMQNAANQLEVAGSFDPSLPQTFLKLPSGQILWVPTASMSEVAGAELAQNNAESTEIVIPVLAEELIVSKRTVDRETVRVETTVETVSETLAVPLTRERFEITRVPLNVQVDRRPEIRTEEDTTVFPVIEERLVMQTVLFLTEEVRIQKIKEVTEQVSEHELRREVVQILRSLA